MKTIISTALAVSLMTMAGVSTADHNANRAGNQYVFFDRANVTHVEPMYETVRIATPHQECYTKEVRHNVHHHGNKSASTVIGGIIGGAVGNKIGKHKGHRKAHTVAGAIIGATIGNKIGNDRGHNHTEVRYQDVCETHTRYHNEQRIIGYKVSYRYKGEFFTTKMNNDPGRFLKVKVHVSPVVD